ncbi:MAG: diguanylate cyclase [Proteobacteria bacterium]|nr:MAG: diguanylate cyclase [Pseudomonadota bacterium]
MTTNLFNGRVPIALVVDDDTMMRLLIRQTLERAGLVCHEAHNGAAAVDKFVETQPDIVLLDVMMPEMDGYEACRRLREKDPGAMVPVLMLTGLDDLDSINRAYEVGATDFISKPISWGVLGHRVRYILRASQAFRDITKHQASLEAAQRIAHLGGWEWTITRNEVYWSAETYRILGLDPQTATPNFDTFTAQVHPEDRDRARQAIRDLLSDGQTAGRALRIIRPDGALRHIQLQAEGSFDISGTLQAVSGTIQDVTELKEAEERIRYLAYYDGVTGLPNRQFFNERLQHALAQSRRHQRQLAVVSLDLDQFKRFNDTLGHAAGNELLVAVSSRLAGVVRQEDTVARAEGQLFDAVARLDGDEFSLLVTDLQHYHDAARVARKLIEELRKPFRAGNQEVFVSASIGLALYPLDGEDGDTLIKNAGAAMHFAKEQGRDNYQFYSRAMNATALEKLAMESQLRRAVERDELLLYYQPKLEISTGRIVGLEALIRWKHPELGLVPPSQFIPLAEETGLIIPIGEWVLRNACRQNIAWQRSGLMPVHVAVNIASPHFRQGGLVASVGAALKDTGAEPRWLEVELTESMLMQSGESTLKTLFQLKDMGVRLAIDDFGTGYSSLSYLKRFPLDTLKIDRSFVKDLPRDPEDAAITKAIVAMSHSLKLSVVAEGVETAEQLAFLQQHGCDLAQGFLFSRPVVAEDVPALLSRGELKMAAAR